MEEDKWTDEELELIGIGLNEAQNPAPPAMSPQSRPFDERTGDIAREQFQQRQLMAQQQQQEMYATEPGTYSSLDADPMTDEEIYEFLGDTVDPVTGELRPAYADGVTPQSPINKSPLSAADRFKLSFSNQKGHEEFLKERFEAVERDGKGNFIVKDNGAWYRTDPEGTGDGNMFDRAREFTMDIVDGADLATLIGAGIAGAALAPIAVPTALATGAGAAALAKLGIVGGVAGVAGATMNTSFGRLAGTYEATPEEQIKDIALEGLYMAAGNVVFPVASKGVKAAGKGIGATIGKAFSNLKTTTEKMGPSPIKKLAASHAAWINDISEESLTRATQRSQHLTPKLKAIDTLKTDSDIVSFINRRATAALADAAKHARQALDDIYNARKADVIKNMPDIGAVRISGKEIVEEAQDNLVRLGLARSTGAKFTPGARREVSPLSADDLFMWAKGLEDQTLASQMVDAGVKKSIHRQYLDLYKTMTSPDLARLSGQGEQAVDLTFRQLQRITQDTFAAGGVHSGTNPALSDASRVLFRSLQSAQEGAIFTNLSKTARPESIAQIQAVRKSYFDLKNEVAPLERIVKKLGSKGARGDTSVIQGDVNSYLSGKVGNTVKIDQLENALRVLSEGDSLASRSLKSAREELMDWGAVMQFHPKASKAGAGFAPSAAAGTAATQVAQNVGGQAVQPWYTPISFAASWFANNTYKKAFSPRRAFEWASQLAPETKQHMAKSGFEALKTQRLMLMQNALESSTGKAAKGLYRPVGSVLTADVLDTWFDSGMQEQMMQQQLLQQATGEGQ